MKHLEQVTSAIDGLTLRERVIVTSAAILLIYGLWYVLWFNGASQERQVAEQRTEQLQQEQQKAEAQIAGFEQAGGSTASALEADLARATKELIAVDEQLTRSTSALVGADQLTAILQEMLAESSALALVSMQTLSVEPISIESDQERELTELADAHVSVYKHSVVLTVRGRYFEVLELLGKLEDKPWKFYWESLRYEVQQYPEAEVQIRVYTLSAEEGLLGV